MPGGQVVKGGGRLRYQENKVEIDIHGILKSLIGVL